MIYFVHPFCRCGHRCSPVPSQLNNQPNSHQCSLPGSLHHVRRCNPAFNLVSSRVSNRRCVLPDNLHLNRASNQALSRASSQQLSHRGVPHRSPVNSQASNRVGNLRFVLRAINQPLFLPTYRLCNLLSFLLLLLSLFEI